MAKTEKRFMFCATKGDLKNLNELKEKYGENYSAILRRALIILHHINFEKKDKEDEK